MRFNSVIYLIGSGNSSNEMGDAISSAPKSRKTFAERKSVRQSEFYQAAASGLNPEITFVIWEKSYSGEKELVYQGSKYTIIRTFEKGQKEIELICSKKR